MTLVGLPAAPLDFRRAHEALIRATKLADVVGIRDSAEAVRVAAQKAKAGLTMANQAAELRLRAERKAGVSSLVFSGPPPADRSKIPATMAGISVGCCRTWTWQRRRPAGGRPKQRCPPTYSRIRAALERGAGEERHPA